MLMLKLKCSGNRHYFVGGLHALPMPNEMRGKEKDKYVKHVVVFSTQQYAEYLVYLVICLAPSRVLRKFVPKIELVLLLMLVTQR